MSEKSATPFIPDCLMAVVAEIAVARGDSFDATISSLIYCGLVNQGNDGDEAIRHIDFLKLSDDLDAELGGAQ